MPIHRGSSTTTPNRTIYALSLAPSRAPLGARARALQGGHPTSTARRLTERSEVRYEARAKRATRKAARSTRPAEKAWGVSSHAAQSPALSRWRRDQIHFSPAARPRLQAGSPEWSVASDAEGGTRRARRAVTYAPVQPATSLGEPPTVLADSERVRPPRSPGDNVSRAHGAPCCERPPTPQAPQARGAQRRPRERSERGSARQSLGRSRDVERPRAFGGRRRHCVFDVAIRRPVALRDGGVIA